MPDRNTYEISALTKSQALKVLVRLATQDWQSLATSELQIGRCEPARRGLVSLFVPTFQEHSRRNRNQQAKAFRDEALAVVADLIGDNKDRSNHANRSMPSKLFDLPVELPAGVAWLAAAARKDAAIPPDGQRLVFIQAADQDAALHALPAILRRGRHVRVIASSLDSGTEVQVVLLEDVADEGSTLAGLLSREQLPTGTSILAAHAAGPFTLWIHHERKLPEDRNLALLGRFLAAAQEAGEISTDGNTFVLLEPDDGPIELYQLIGLENASPLHEVAEALPTAQPLEARFLTVAIDGDPNRALAERLGKLDQRVGYRVSLRAIPSRLGPEIDVEQLGQQIRELQDDIDIITALRAPQKGLLRFSEVQLPAMVDALRSLPQQAVAAEGKVHYAAGYSAGDGRPDHYLLYDLAETAMRFGEVQWRQRTEDRPISYWLDPFIARAQVEGSSRTKVFVPYGLSLVPSLATFGGTIDETLLTILADQFGGPNPLFSDPTAEPLFLFTPADDGSRNLRVEVIDAGAFAPLHLQLPWINDHLQVFDPPPEVVDREQLAAAARGFFMGEAAQALSQQLDGQVQGVRSAWQQASAAIRQECTLLLSDLVSEMDHTAERIALVAEYLRRAEQRMREDEQAMRSAATALSGQGELLDAFEIKDKSLREARTLFLERVTAEVELGQTAMDEAERRIAGLRERLTDLREETD